MGTSFYTTFPILNEAILKEGISPNLLAAWYILRTLIRDRKLSGWITKTDAAQYITEYLGITQSHAYNVIQDGNGIFWACSTNRAGEQVIYLHGVLKILQSFNALPGKKLLGKLNVRQYPIEVLHGTAQERRAHFHKTTIIKHEPCPEPPLPKKNKTKLTREQHIEYFRVCKNIKVQSKPITRNIIEERTHVQRHTQRKYEKICQKRGDKVWVQENFVLVLPLTWQEFRQLAFGVSTLRRDEILKLWDRVIEVTSGEPLGGRFQTRIFGDEKGIWRQVGNSYSEQNARYIRNPLWVKYHGHSSQQKKSTKIERLAGTLQEEALQLTFWDKLPWWGEDFLLSASESLHQATQSTLETIQCEEPQHNYVYYMAKSGTQRKKQRRAEKSIAERCNTWYTLRHSHRSHTPYRRRATWDHKDPQGYTHARLKTPHLP